MWTDFSRDKNPDCIDVHKEYLAAGKDTIVDTRLNAKITPLMPYLLRDVIYVHLPTINYPGLVNLESYSHPLEYFTFFNVEKTCIIIRFKFISPETRRLATQGEDWQLNFFDTTLIDGTDFSILLEKIYIDRNTQQGKQQYKNFMKNILERYNSFPRR